MPNSSFSCDNLENKDCFNVRSNNITETIFIACHRTSKIYTRVDFESGGSLIVLSSESESWIEIFDRLNKRLPYWYRCGKKHEWHYYFWITPK